MDNSGGGRIHIEVVTPYELFFEGGADQITLPAIDGEIGILPGHAAIIIALNPGEVRINDASEIRYFSASDGYAKVELDNVVVVVGAAEWPEQIDLKRAKIALERRLKRLQDPATTKMEALHTQRGILRAKARIKVAEKYQKTKGPQSDDLSDMSQDPAACRT